MINPIAEPWVQSVDTDADSPLVHIEATPAGAATVWINRPERRNALDAMTVAALHEAFNTLRGAEGVRIVFVRGVGGDFSIGPDTEALTLSNDLTEADHRENAAGIASMLRALTEIPALTVALVEGEAVGVGAALAATCDVTVALADARFRFPDIRLGLVAAITAPYLIAAVGARTARRLLALGEPIAASEALAAGLANTVVADVHGLTTEQARLTQTIMSCAPGAVAATKSLIAEAAAHPSDPDLMDKAAHHYARVRMGDEAREGVAAFIEGRKPAWSSI